MDTIKLEDFPVELLRAGSEVNVIVGPADPEMVELMFRAPPGQETDAGEVFLQTDRDITWPQLLAALRCFPSVTQARKNWCQGQKRKQEIERGFQQISVGKARKIFIHLYKPFPKPG